MSERSPLDFFYGVAWGLVLGLSVAGFIESCRRISAPKSSLAEPARMIKAGDVLTLDIKDDVEGTSSAILGAGEHRVDQYVVIHPDGRRSIIFFGEFPRVLSEPPDKTERKDAP